MSFSPGKLQRESLSPKRDSSPFTPVKQQPIQSTKWPLSPEITYSSKNADEIVAAAKAKISRWSDGYTNVEIPKQQVPAPQKSKFLPKASPKFDPRQTALNKLAAKRIALAKSKAKSGVKVGNKLLFSNPTDNKVCEVVNKPQESSLTPASIQISLGNFNNRFAPPSGCSTTTDKPTASIAPMMSSTPSPRQPPVTASLTFVSVAESVDIIPQPVIAKSSIGDKNVSGLDLSGPRPVSAQLLQAMQATLTEGGNPNVTNSSSTTSASLAVAEVLSKQRTGRLNH